jgi:hypothetical protein
MDARSEAFNSIVMDNLNSDMSPRPDLPGSSDYVFRYINAIFDGAGTARHLPIPHLLNLTQRNTVYLVL